MPAAALDRARRGLRPLRRGVRRPSPCPVLSAGMVVLRVALAVVICLSLSGCWGDESSEHVGASRSEQVRDGATSAAGSGAPEVADQPPGQQVRRLRPYHVTCVDFVDGIRRLGGSARERLLEMAEPIVASGLLSGERSFYWTLFVLRLRGELEQDPCTVEEGIEAYTIVNNAQLRYGGACPVPEAVARRGATCSWGPPMSDGDGPADEPMAVAQTDVMGGPVGVIASMVLRPVGYGWLPVDVGSPHGPHGTWPVQSEEPMCEYPPPEVPSAPRPSRQMSDDEIFWEGIREQAESPGHAFAYDFTIGMHQASAFALGSWNPLLDLFFAAAESASGETQSYDQLHQGWLDDEAHALGAATIYGIGQNIPALVDNRWVGDEGERIIHELLQSRGYESYSLANRSNQGIDILAIKPGADGEPRYYFFEVKTSRRDDAPSLSHQQRDVHEFIITRLNRATGYSNITGARHQKLLAALAHVKNEGRIGAAAVQITRVLDPGNVNILIRRLSAAPNAPSVAGCVRSQQRDRVSHVLFKWLKSLAT